MKELSPVFGKKNTMSESFGPVVNFTHKKQD